MRLSVSRDLLGAALAEIKAAGHTRILVLGDLSEDGTPDQVDFVLEMISQSGLGSWVVPGNHDVRLSDRTLRQVVDRHSTCFALPGQDVGLADGISLAGYGLHGRDGDSRCLATQLPHVNFDRGRMLVWAGHYPVLSQEGRLDRQGLKYAGDLLNLRQVEAKLAPLHLPVLVLHGHLHVAVLAQSGHMLQIGVPALVEWPHTWFEVTIEIEDGVAEVTGAMHPVQGLWSTPEVDTMLDRIERGWRYQDGLWS